MKIILLKSTKLGGELTSPDGKEIEVSEETGQSLINQGIAKDANSKETVIVKDETLSLEIKKLKKDKQDLSDDNEAKVLEIERLKELLNAAIDSSKGTIPAGAEEYIPKVDLSQ